MSSSRKHKLQKALSKKIWLSIILILTFSLFYFLLGPRVARFFRIAFPLPFSSLDWKKIEDFNKLYKYEPALYEAKNKKSLFITGNVHDNTVGFDSLYIVPGEKQESFQDGDYMLKLMNSSGKVIKSTSFRLKGQSFELLVNYPPGAQVIQIQYREKNLKEAVISTKVLRDAVDNLSDFAFKINPDTTRKEIYKDIDQMELAIAPRELQVSISKTRQFMSKKDYQHGLLIMRDLKRELDDKLLDDHRKENPPQYSKKEVLALLDTLIYRTRVASLQPNLQTQDICNSDKPLYYYTSSSELPLAIFSPDGQYYFNIINSHFFLTKFIKIFSSDTNKEIGRYYSFYSDLIVYCWSQDKNGLYIADFEPGWASIGIIGIPDKKGPVKKLLIP